MQVAPHGALGPVHRLGDFPPRKPLPTALWLGLRAAYALGPEASLSFRGNYLGAARFSGGGSAPLGLELALGLSVGARNGRLRLTADYEFQRVDRKTNPGGSGEVKVPIEQSLARIGVAVGF